MSLLPPDNSVQGSRLRAVLRLAGSCEYEAGHSHQVDRLALRLFDELHPLHGLGGEARLWLHWSALLHDIGWIRGQRGHHKTALRAILGSSLLPFDERERLIIGSIARYHRKALPTEAHGHFAALTPQDRHLVRTLASLLRVADGLDRTHWNLVDDLRCEIWPERVVVQCAVRAPAEAERETALSKGLLFEQVFNRCLVVDLLLEQRQLDAGHEDTLPNHSKNGII